MGASDNVGELHYRIVIDGYDDAKQKLADLGGVSSGRGSSASQTGTGPSQTIMGGGSSLSGGASFSGIPGSAGRSRSASGAQAGTYGPFYQYSSPAGPAYQYSTAAQPGGARGSIPMFPQAFGPSYQYSQAAGPFYQYSQEAFPGGGAGQLSGNNYGPFYQYSQAAGPALPTGFSAFKRNLGMAVGGMRARFNTGGVSISMGGAVVGAAMAYAALQTEGFISRDRQLATQGNVAGTRAGSLSAAYDRASNQYESFGLLGKAWGMAVDIENVAEGLFHDPIYPGPTGLARGKTRTLAGIQARDNLADSQRNAIYDQQTYLSGSPRDPVNAAARDLIAAQKSRDNVVIPAEREVTFIRARINSGDLNGQELDIARQQYTALRRTQDSARSQFADESREIDQRRWVYEREQSNATRYNYGMAESMQTATRGDIYSREQSQLDALNVRQRDELRQFDTENSTAIRGPDGNMISRINPGARQQRDSIVTRQGAERDLQSREATQRLWVYEREQSNATQYNYVAAASMQTAAGGQRYSAAQSQLRAQQDAELRRFDTENSIATKGPDGNVTSRLGPGAQQQRDSLVTRQAAERELQAAERSHTLDVANLNLTTNERIQQSLKRRDPFGARAAAITGGAESEVQAYMYAEMPDQARRAAKLGVGDLELTRRNYLEGFRGVQYDVRNNPVDNPRDQENPAQVLQTIAQYIKELQSIVKALGSDS